MTLKLFEFSLRHTHRFRRRSGLLRDDPLQKFDQGLKCAPVVGAIRSEDFARVRPSLRGPMTRRHRRRSTSKTREIVEAYLNGEALHALSKQHDVCRILNRILIEKYERREYDDDAVEAGQLSAYGARITALERLVDRQALELEL